mmetsp:Transcript_52470/g.124958  ORF Transcript_52470/g.124958 Transcript_52470/m.124958 type:complete len:203 (-) Transcript_52470:825-1433(-)
MAPFSNAAVSTCITLLMRGGWKYSRTEQDHAMIAASSAGNVVSRVVTTASARTPIASSNSSRTFGSSAARTDAVMPSWARVHMHDERCCRDMLPTTWRAARQRAKSVFGSGSTYSHPNPDMQFARSCGLKLPHCSTMRAQRAVMSAASGWCCSVPNDHSTFAVSWLLKCETSRSDCCAHLITAIECPGSARVAQPQSEFATS